MWLTVTMGTIAGPAEAVATEGGYTVVVSKSTGDDPQWKPVVGALLDKHQAKLVTYERSVDESLTELRRQFPRYICFVARPAEVTRDFVASAAPRSSRAPGRPSPIRGVTGRSGCPVRGGGSQTLRVEQHGPDAVPEVVLFVPRLRIGHGGLRRVRDASRAGHIGAKGAGRG